MACKGCQDSNISDEYYCTICHVKNNTFKIAVITNIPDDGSLGNLADNIISLNRTALLSEIRNTFTIKEAINLRRQFIENDNSYDLITKEEVFKKGELLLVDPEFGRGLFCGRKPDNWDVDYVLFNADQLLEASKLADQIIKNGGS